MSKKKTRVAIMCGGTTYEHEVSVISGIQSAQNINRDLYEPFFLFFNKTNDVFLIKNIRENSNYSP